MPAPAPRQGVRGCRPSMSEAARMLAQTIATPASNAHSGGQGVRGS